jgi:two-component system, NtrC family, response regulator HydG
LSDFAYLVIREGTKWSDVHRLVPGESATIGRANTSRIVLKDDRCSRNHAEVFFSGGQWTLRDLESRNGSYVGKERVKEDIPLKSTDIISVGRSQLVFVHRLSEAFDDPAAPSVKLPEKPTSDHVINEYESENVLTPYHSATITHRRGQTKFLTPDALEGDAADSFKGKAAAKLCRLAFDLAQSTDLPTMANLTLEGLFEGTQTDTGAVLLLPQGSKKTPHGDDLELLASRSHGKQNYHQVSHFLATTVMREGEAVLARNIMGDSTLGSRNSQGEIDATSVLVAPIRQGTMVLGLIHLYSTDADKVPDADDLEFTLAVADTVAVALKNLSQRDELAENLTQMQDENTQLRERLGVQSEIVGSSRAMRSVSEEITRAASTTATVLVRGESGTGKELVARAVHFSSPRSKNMFVCLNCAALSEDLLASELFGHERGAFTGATDRKIGKFEAADGGTLMLDEIGEMSPGIQAKFLRVLEGHPFERVGGNKPVKVNVRVIAATNRDLERDVANGLFRRDLFFRLHVLEIVVPSLRKRTDDISELANYFLQRFILETGRRIDGFTDRAMEQLTTYRWPGNVRELKNVIERAVLLCQGRKIDQENLLLSKLSTSGDTREIIPMDGEGFAIAAASFEPQSLVDIEKYHIKKMLDFTKWNKSQASKLLGIERSTLDRKIRRYKISNGGN